MEEELPDHRAVPGKVALEGIDVLEPLLPDVVGDEVGRQPLSLQDLRVDRQSRMMLSSEVGLSDGAEIHGMIARAILDGQPVQASQLMREHMREYLEFALAHDPAFLEQTVSWH